MLTLYILLFRRIVKKYVRIPRISLVINVCNQGKTLCSPCIFLYVFWYLFKSGRTIEQQQQQVHVQCVCVQLTVLHVSRQTVVLVVCKSRSLQPIVYLLQCEVVDVLALLIVMLVMYTVCVCVCVCVCGCVCVVCVCGMCVCVCVCVSSLGVSVIVRSSRCVGLANCDACYVYRVRVCVCVLSLG